MHPLPYDPVELRERCRVMARGIADAGGAPTVAFNSETGEVLRAFDRSDPNEQAFIESFEGLPFSKRMPDSDIVLLIYRQEDIGKRRITRFVTLRRSPMTPGDTLA